MTTDKISIDPGFDAANRELQRRREQAESVKDKDPQFRVEFRFGGASRHYQYFITHQDALAAEANSIQYSPWGDVIIKRPTSKQIQKKGPRGGWNKYENR